MLINIEMTFMLLKNVSKVVGVRFLMEKGFEPLHA